MLLSRGGASATSAAHCSPSSRRSATRSRRAALGLTEEQAASRPSASELSLSGLLKHAAEVELNWLRLAQQRPNERQRTQDTWQEAFRLAGDEDVPGVLAFWDGVVKEFEEFVRSVPSLDDTFPLPEAPWFP